MANSSKHNIYEFAEFRLDAEKLMLYRGDGEISLPPKVIKTLTVLVESCGQILSKDELIERVWAGSIVEESNLSQYLYILRKTLGPRQDGSPYIETLRRRGYRFNCDVVFGDKQPTQNGIGSAAAAAMAEVGVERHGNVLRLVDWLPERNDAADTDKIPAVDETAARLSGPGNFELAAVIAAALLITFAITFYLWYKPSPAASAVPAKNEMAVQRLTNGGFPMSGAVSLDGNYFAYTENDGETSRIWLQSVGQASRIEITSSADKVICGKTFSPDGRYIYYEALSKDDSRRWAVYRVPTIGGPSAKILDNVSAGVSFSPDGEQVVTYRPTGSSGEAAMIVADKDGGNERTLLTHDGPSVFIGAPAWSPDGKTIAFAETNLGPLKDSSTGHLSLFNVASGETRRFSDENWDTIYRMEWTRDGTGLVMIGTRENEAYTARRDQVYYISYPSGVSRRITSSGIRHSPDTLGVTNSGAILALTGSRSSQIWSMDTSGEASSAVQITNGLFDGRPGLAPLPDGRVGYLTYAGDNMGVWIMNGDGSGARELTSYPTIIEELRGDPLGRYLIYSSRVEGHSHLFRIDVDGNDRKQLTFGDSHEVDSAVSPDGNWIVYGTTVLKGKFATTRLMKSPIDGGEAVSIGDNECSRPHFSPDGKYLSCVSEADKEMIILSAADGTEVRRFRVPTLATVNFGVRWTPTSDGVVFIHSDKESSNLWVQPIDGREPTRLTNFTSGTVYNYAFSPVGGRLFIARGYPVQEVILIKDFM